MKKLLGMLLLSLVLFNMPSQMLAAEKASETGLGFTYENILPENQQRDASFFDLSVKAGQKQTLKTKVTNTTKEAQTIIVTIGNAGTTSDGTVNYLSSEKLPGKVYLTDVATAPKEIKLKAGEEKTLEIKLTIPAAGFSGTIMGGVDLARKVDTKEKSSESGVDNKYSYLYSISLTGEKKAEKMLLESDKTTFDESNHSLTTAIVNPTNNLVKNLKLERTVTAVNSKKVLATAATEELKIAPTSSLVYLQEEVELVPGEYLVHTTAIVGEDKWTWEHPLSVTEKTVTSITTPVEVEPISKSFKLPLLILGSSILLFTVIIFICIKLVNNWRKKKG